MKKHLLLIGLLISFALSVDAQSQFTNFSAYAGANYYFAPADGLNKPFGDGRSEWGKLRALLKVGRTDESTSQLSLGIFLGGFTGGDKINNVLSLYNGYSFGLAVNYGIIAPSTQYWFWLDAGVYMSYWKGQSDSTKNGERLLLDMSRGSQGISIEGGLIIKVPDEEGRTMFPKLELLYNLKFPSSSTGSNSLNNKKIANPLPEKFRWEGDMKVTIASIRLSRENPDGVRFEPKIAGGVYSTIGDKIGTQYGIDLTLAGKYGQEIIALQGRVKQGDYGSRIIYDAGFFVNFVEVIKSFKRNY